MSSIVCFALVMVLCARGTEQTRVFGIGAYPGAIPCNTNDDCKFKGCHCKAGGTSDFSEIFYFGCGKSETQVDTMSQDFGCDYGSTRYYTWDTDTVPELLQWTGLVKNYCIQEIDSHNLWQHCKGIQTAQDCYEGTYYLESHKKCLVCPITPVTYYCRGWSASDNSAPALPCDICPLNTYQSQSCSLKQYNTPEFGYFAAAFQNNVCSPCPPGKWCNGMTYNDCTSESCPPGQYSGCIGNGYRVGCTVCRVCSTGTYESAACTSSQNRNCTACTVCTAGATYESVACNATTNRVCSACSTCIAGTNYRTTPCNTTSDTVCTACTICPAGTFEFEPCTATTDRVCQSCAPGEFDYKCGRLVPWTADCFCWPLLLSLFLSIPRATPRGPRAPPCVAAGPAPTPSPAP